MRTLLLILGLFLTTNLVIAQQSKAVIEFENKVHDYGTIEEMGGKVTHTFTFTNTGSQPLIITRVQATCGCTTSDYTKQPVAPNQTGFVKAVFDPKHRPGPFTKTINIYSNSTTPTLVLTIKGKVTPKPRTIEDDYPQLMGTVRLETSQFSFMNIKNTEVAKREIKIINMGTEPATITFSNVPTYVTVKQVPAVLKPNEKGTLVATFDAKKVKDLGFRVHRISTLVNNVKTKNSMLSISAVIKEDFSHLSAEELANAPKIKFTKTDHDFGSVTAGSVAEYEYTFKNEGKTPLIIRKVKTGCGCTASTPPTEAIQPGETSSIKVSFNTKNRKGRQVQYINVYCNAPSQPEIKLKIAGIVNAVQ